jgi:tetratricopeptide (TPR) repeat protein
MWCGAVSQDRSVSKHHSAAPDSETNRDKLLRRMRFGFGKLKWCGISIGLLATAFTIWSHTPQGRLQWIRWQLIHLDSRKPLSREFDDASTLDLVAGVRNNPHPELWLNWLGTKGNRVNLDYRNLTKIVEMAKDMGDTATAQRLIQQVVVVTNTLGRDDGGRVGLFTRIAHVQYKQFHDPGKARHFLDQAVRMMQHQDRSAYFKVLSLIEIAEVYGELQDFQQARALLAQAMQIAQSEGEKEEKVSLLNSIAQAYGSLKAVDQQQTLLEQTKQMARSESDRIRKVEQLVGVATAFAASPQSTQADVLLNEAFQTMRSIPEEKAKAEALVNIVRTTTKLKDQQQAAAILGAALETTQTLQDQSTQSHALTEIIETVRQSKDPATGKTLLEKAQKIAVPLVNSSERLDFALPIFTIAEAYKQLQNPVAAISVLDQAAQLTATQAGSDDDIRFLYRLAELYLDLKAPQKVPPLLAKAQKLSTKFRPKGHSNPDDTADLTTIYGQMKDAKAHQQKFLQSVRLVLSPLKDPRNRHQELRSMLYDIKDVPDLAQDPAFLMQVPQVLNPADDPNYRSLALQEIARMAPNVKDTNGRQTLLTWLTQNIQSLENNEGKANALGMIAQSYIHQGEADRATALLDEFTSQHGHLKSDSIPIAYAELGRFETALQYTKYLSDYGKADLFATILIVNAEQQDPALKLIRQRKAFRSFQCCYVY